MSDNIVDRAAEVAKAAGESLRETFAGTQDQGQGAGRDNKDRTQTSASEDAHDLASAAEDRTNEAIQRAKETAQGASERADDAYRGTKGFLADESEKVRNATEDIKGRAAESMPGRDTQDPRVTTETGENPGYEKAREMAEKTEDL